MKTLLKTRFLLLLPVLSSSIDLFARAGGGGSIGGGNESPILTGFIITIICSVIISAVLFYKIKKSFEKPELESEPEPSFSLDYDELKHHVKKTFFKMQDAWMSRSIDVAKGIITESLYLDYKERLEDMKNDNKINVLSQIEIKKIRIIDCEDYMEGSHLRFIAQIHGKMIDYTLDELTGDIIDNSLMETEDFTDTYHFIRKDKEWILDYIDNFVTVFDVIQTKDYQEESKYEKTFSTPLYP